MNEYSLTISTFPDEESAKAAARCLVEKRLAACAQMLPINSVYRWKDEICDEVEVMLFVKSKSSLFGKIAEAIRAVHPYEVPEIVQMPLSDGLPEYLKWVDDCTN